MTATNAYFASFDMIASLSTVKQQLRHFVI